MVNCNDYVLERVEIHNCFPAGKNEVISILQHWISIFQNNSKTYHVPN